MERPLIASPNAPRADEDPSDPNRNPDRDRGRRELSRRGLLIDETDRESLPEAGGFVREVKIPRRSRGRGPSWPTDRLA